MALTADQLSQVERLKLLVGGALGDYTDEQLWGLIQTGGTLNSIAAQVWSEYAAQTAVLVNVAEGSSRRQLGDLFKQAQSMAQYFLSLDELVDPTPVGVTQTMPIRRP